MPGEPGHRHTGDAPHASDPCRRGGGDTPYDDARALLMTHVVVGATTYLPHDHRTGERT